jgi:hypothetical protein
MKSKASSEEGRSEGAQDSGGSVSNAAAGGEGGAGTGGAAEATGVSNQRVSSPPFGSHFPSGLSAMFDRARSAGDDDEDDDNDDDDDDDDDDDEAWMPRPPRHAENLHVRTSIFYFPPVCTSLHLLLLFFGIVHNYSSLLANSYQFTACFFYFFLWFIFSVLFLLPILRCIFIWTNARD